MVFYIKTYLIVLVLYLYIKYQSTETTKTLYIPEWMSKYLFFGKDEIVFVIDGVDIEAFEQTTGYSIDRLFHGEYTETETGLELRIDRQTYTDILDSFYPLFDSVSSFEETPPETVQSLADAISNYDLKPCDVAVCSHPEHPDSGRPNTVEEWKTLVSVIQFTASHNGTVYYTN